MPTPKTQYLIAVFKRKQKMITIDGSYGEGGGQILRTSLALSLITGKPFTIKNIRAGRKKPGLMRQHLTALNAAAEIGNAAISGNKTGSTSFSFEPETLKSGKYHHAIGSAGSCTLVLQTILPALMIADGPSEIILEGGTHNPFAPPYDFLEKAFLPVLSKMGAQIKTNLDTAGFYPAGGGRFSVSVTPAAKLTIIDLTDRGNTISTRANAVVSNLPVNIAERELRVVQKNLNWEEEDLKTIIITDSPGPGNILTLVVESDHITEVFTGFGERGVSSERVAKRTIKPVREYLGSGAAVGRYLADQLLVPMAIAGGGSFRTLSPSKHTTTNIEIIREFLDVTISINEINQNLFDIVIGS